MNDRAPQQDSLRDHLAYPAVIQEDHGHFSGQLLGMTLHASGTDKNEVIKQLEAQLTDHLQTIISQGEDLPAVPAATPAHVTWIFPTSDDTFVEKASEKFLDFTKAEFDRVLANTKLAEERARQNMTFALVAIPVMTFLKPKELTDWSIAALWLAAIALILIIAILILGGVATKSTSVKDMGWNEKGLEDERLIVWYSYRTYRDELYHLQKAWIQNTTEMNRVRHSRFKLVDAQSWCLVGLASDLAILLLALMFNW